MIEDKELRELFEVESDEQLQKLNQLTLKLEKDPKNSEILEGMMRLLHTLKGSARMVGASGVEVLAHSFEDLIGDVKSGKIESTKHLIDFYYHLLDSIQKIVTEEVKGIPAEVDMVVLLDQLKTGEFLPTASSQPGKSAQNGSAPSKAKPKKKPKPAAVKKKPQSPEPKPKPKPEDTGRKPESSTNGEARSEVLRVKSHKLDSLMTHAGELLVAKNSLRLRSREFEEVGEIWEDLRFLMRKQLALSQGEDEAEESRLSTYERIEAFDQMIQGYHNSFIEDSSKLEYVSSKLETEIRSVRLQPLSNLFGLFPRMTRDLVQSQHKEIDLVIEGGEIEADKKILEELKEVILHLLRNAVDHGLESPEERKKTQKPEKGLLSIKADRKQNSILITVEDDGKGLDHTAIKEVAARRGILPEEELDELTEEEVESLVFEPGFSTSRIVTDVSGRGVGLDAVKAKVSELGGTIKIHSVAGEGSRFEIQLPQNLATHRVLTVMCGGWVYALPFERILASIRIGKDEIFRIEGQQSILWKNKPITLVMLADLLEQKQEQKEETELFGEKHRFYVIIIGLDEKRLALIVDELLDEQNIVFKQQGHILKRVRNQAGATILSDGEICSVLDPQDLIDSIYKHGFQSGLDKRLDDKKVRKQRILIAEDSITTRTQEKRILESAGYEVVTAIDGVDAFQTLSQGSFDALISDIQMPRMDGLELAKKIRQNKSFIDLPIILVTSLATEEDKKKGVEVGANAYITKGTFDQSTLLETLKRLI